MVSRFAPVRCSRTFGGRKFELEVPAVKVIRWRVPFESCTGLFCDTARSPALFATRFGTRGVEQFTVMLGTVRKGVREVVAVNAQL